MQRKAIQLRVGGPQQSSCYELCYDDLDYVSKYCVLARYELYPLIVDNDSDVVGETRGGAPARGAVVQGVPIAEVCKAVLEAAIAVSILIKKGSVCVSDALRVRAISAFVLRAIATVHERVHAAVRLADLETVRAAVSSLLEVELVGDATAVPSVGGFCLLSYLSQIGVRVAHCTITSSPLHLCALQSALSPERCAEVYEGLDSLKVTTLDHCFISVLYRGLGAGVSAGWVPAECSEGTDGGLRSAILAVMTASSDSAPVSSLQRLQRVDSLISSLLHFFSCIGGENVGPAPDSVLGLSHFVWFTQELLRVLCDVATTVVCEERDMQFSLCYQLYQVTCWLLGGLDHCPHSSSVGSSVCSLRLVSDRLACFGSTAERDFPLLFIHQQLAMAGACGTDGASPIAPLGGGTIWRILGGEQHSVIGEQCGSDCLRWPYAQKFASEMDDLIKSAYRPLEDGMSRSDGLLRFRLQLQDTLSVLVDVGRVGTPAETCPIRTLFHLLLGSISTLSPWAKCGAANVSVDVSEDSVGACLDLFLVMLQQFAQLDCGEDLCCCARHADFVEPGAGSSEAASSSGARLQGGLMRSATLRCCLHRLGPGLLPPSLLALCVGAADWAGGGSGGSSDLHHLPPAPSGDLVLTATAGAGSWQLLPVALLVWSLAALETASPCSSSLVAARNYLSTRQLSAKTVLISICAQHDLPWSLVVVVDIFLVMAHASKSVRAAIPAFLDAVRGTMDELALGSSASASGHSFPSRGVAGPPGCHHVVRALRAQVNRLQSAHRVAASPTAPATVQQPQLQLPGEVISESELAALGSHVVQECSREWSSVWLTGETQQKCEFSLLKFIQECGTAHCRKVNRAFSSRAYCSLLNMLADCDIRGTTASDDGVIVGGGNVYARVHQLLGKNDAQLLVYYQDCCQELSRFGGVPGGAGRGRTALSMHGGRFSAAGGATAADVVLVRHIRVLSSYLSLVDAHLSELCGDSVCLPVNLEVVGLHVEALLKHFVLVSLAPPAPGVQSAHSLNDQCANIGWEGVIVQWLKAAVPEDGGVPVQPRVLHSDLLLPLRRYVHLLHAPHLGAAIAACLERAVDFLVERDAGAVEGFDDYPTAVEIHAVCLQLLLVKDIILGCCRSDLLVPLLSNIVFSSKCSRFDSIIGRYVNHLGTRERGSSSNASLLLVELVNNVLVMFFSDIAHALVGCVVAESDLGVASCGHVLPVLLPVMAALHFGAECTTMSAFRCAAVASVVVKFAALNKYVCSLVGAKPLSLQLRTEPVVALSGNVSSQRQFLLPCVDSEVGVKSILVSLTYRADVPTDGVHMVTLICDVTCSAISAPDISGQGTTQPRGVMIAMPDLCKALCARMSLSSQREPSCAMDDVSGAVLVNFALLRQLQSGLAASYWRALSSLRDSTWRVVMSECFKPLWDAVTAGCGSLSRGHKLLIACLNEHSVSAPVDVCFPWLSTLGGVLAAHNDGGQLDSRASVTCSLLLWCCCNDVERCLQRTGEGGLASSLSEVNILYRLVQMQGAEGGACDSEGESGAMKYTVNFIALLYSLALFQRGVGAADLRIVQLCGTLVDLVQASNERDGGVGNGGGNGGLGAGWMSRSLISQHLVSEVLASGSVVQWQPRTTAHMMDCFAKAETTMGSQGAAAGRGSQYQSRLMAASVSVRGGQQSSTPSRRGSMSARNMMDVLLSQTAPALPPHGSARRTPGSGGSVGRPPPPSASGLTPPIASPLAISTGAARSTPLSARSSHSSPSEAVQLSPFVGNKRLFEENAHGPSGAASGGASGHPSGVGEVPAKARRAPVREDTETETETRWSPPKSFMVFSKLT